MTSPNRVYWAQCQLVIRGDQRAFQFAVETHHEDLGVLIEDLRKNSVVAVTRLELVADGRGGSMIRRREPIGLGCAGLVMLQNYTKPVWEPEA